MNKTVRRGLREMLNNIYPVGADHSSTEDGNDEAAASFTRIENRDKDGKLTFYIRPEINLNSSQEHSDVSRLSCDVSTLSTNLKI